MLEIHATSTKNLITQVIVATACVRERHRLFVPVCQLVIRRYEACTVDSKIIRALVIVRVKKLLPNEILGKEYLSSRDL